MGMTLRDILKQVAEVKQCWFNGLTTGTGTTSTLICSSLIGATFGAGMRVNVAGADREIVSLDKNTGTLTFRPANGTAIAASTEFTITPWRWSTMIAALMRAMYAMGEDWKLTRATETTSSLDGVHSVWDLPSDCESVSRIQIKAIGDVANTANLTSIMWEPYPFYTIFSVDGVRKLQLREPVAGPILIHYQALITVPNEPNDYVQLGDNDDRDAIGFLVNRTISELLFSDQLTAPTSEAARIIGDIAMRYRSASEAIRAAHMPTKGSSQRRRDPLPRHI